MVTKISKLFRINNPSYFYSTDSKLPRNLEKLEMNSFQNLQTPNCHVTDSTEFQETMRILNDVINMINIFLALTNEQTTERFKQLGTKGLFLSPYIKSKDILALTDILPFTTDQTTRDELLELM